MAIKDALLPEYDHEMGTTRKLLERVPDANLAWKPHQKSMSMGELAAHLATIPQWTGVILDESSFDIGGSDVDPHPAPPSRTHVVETFDRTVAAARAGIDQKSDAELMAPWTLKKDGQEMFTLPRIAALRSFVLNHSIHHRGQLSVYLRLQDVPLPSIYGPTADEPM